MCVLKYQAGTIIFYQLFKLVEVPLPVFVAIKKGAAWISLTTLISALTSNFGAAKFCDDMTCVLLSISQPNLYQIQLVRGVSESLGPAESKTVIEI